ncbi:MFS transporter [Salinicoccus sp. RF5]|uniref:MFS transporter n=1 Tax=Salinicoccus sp. RF5 TaxID=2748874 RepID=UPI001E507783|nr:MFS transporter [Salinicoccus sp. RF5]MCC4722544.1 MFS transporter [Salinicoccus sp. RF5]
MSDTYKERLWTKDFVFTSVANLILMLSLYLLLVTMATYAMDTYDASVSMGGFVSSIFIIGALFGRLYGGKRIAVVGNRKMLLIGTVSVLLATSLYFLPLGLYPLMVLRFLHGLAMGLATTATSTIVSQIIPTSRSGEGIGYFSMSVVMATAIGPLIGVMLLTQFGFNSIFLFSLIMAALSLVLSLSLQPPEVKVETGRKGFRITDYFEARALPISIAMFVLALAYSSILSFVTEYAAEINLVEAGSFFFLVYGMSVLLSRPFTGRLMDQRGANIVVYPALVSFAAGMLMLSQSFAGWMFLAAAVLMGLGYGNFQSIAQALAIKLTPHHRMGLANSTYFIALDLGLGLGPLMLGYIVPVSGYRGMYMVLVAVILAGIAVYHFMHGRRDGEVTVGRNGA